MRQAVRLFGPVVLTLWLLSACVDEGEAGREAEGARAGAAREESAKPETGSSAGLREIVIVHTNDFESALDPVTAFWLDGSPEVGGAAHLSARIDAMREAEASIGNPLFLFDSGDMFTGLLSRLTYGEVMMEMMISMRYDAMAIGNHEFDYGSKNFLEQLQRVPFPVLSANTFHRGTEILYTRPHAIVERDGFRIGVIGIIGEDAASVVLPSGVADLEFRDPIPYVRESVQELEPLVDLIVVLAHQGKTGPMQSDQEADPEVWRDFDADIAVVEAVPEVDLFLGGHAHRGIDPPYVHPKTGAIISQTFGHGTKLGVFRLWVDETGKIARHSGGLLTPFTAEHAPDARLQAKVDAYKQRHSEEIETVVGSLEQRLTRKYLRESSMGNFVADVIREASGAEVGVVNSGGLRADLDPGPVTSGEIVDVLPFLNYVVTVELSGREIVELLEQGLSLERGIIQVSGLVAKIDLERPIGERLLDLAINDEPLKRSRTYSVVTNSFMAEGGDLYSTFLDKPWVKHDVRTVGDVVAEYFRNRSEPVPLPAVGRLVRVQEAAE